MYKAGELANGAIPPGAACVGWQGSERGHEGRVPSEETKKKGPDQFSATNAAALRQGWQQTVAARNEGEYGGNAGAFLRRTWR